VIVRLAGNYPTTADDEKRVRRSGASWRWARRELQRSVAPTFPAIRLRRRTMRS